MWLKINAFTQENLLPIWLLGGKVYLKILEVDFDSEVQNKSQVDPNHETQNYLIVRVHAVVYLSEAQQDVVETDETGTCHLKDVTGAHHTFKLQFFLANFVVFMEV